jgi:molybdate transport system substrate-binding protein
MRISARQASVAISLFAATSARADAVTIAAAASLKPAMEALGASFSSTSPKTPVRFSFGSSGKLVAQIREGAPFDLFFSADLNFPREIQRAGLAASEPKVFALGALVLWSTLTIPSGLTIEGLTNARFEHIAIANPKLAPYGARAEEALRSAGVYEKVRAKLVFGNDVAQAAQFAQTGNAQVALIARSLALSPELARTGTSAPVPDALYSPLEQGFVLLKRGADKAGAQEFARFVETPAAAAIFKRHGFDAPAPLSKPKTTQSR